jgi:polyvinyl alcohol dehydrogenase (cytochrome)
MESRCSSIGFTRHGRWLRGTLIATALSLIATAAFADPVITGVSARPVSPGSYVAIYGSGFGDHQGGSYVMLGPHFIPVVAWSNAAVNVYVPPTSMVMGPGETPTVVIVQQPGAHKSNGFVLNIAGTGATTPPPAVSGTAGGTSPGTTTGQTPATGTVTPAAQPAMTQAVDLSNAHGSTQTTLSSANVTGLHLAWMIPTKGSVTHMPLVDNGHVFFADWAGDAYAADATTGQILWQKHLQDPNLSWPWWGFAGVGAVGQGTLFEASVEGNAFAVDENTGAIKWQTKIANNTDSGNISQLLYNNGLVYIGLSSVEEALSLKPGFVATFQGAIMALDANTGKVVWQHNTVQPPANGVAVWSSFAVDPAMNALFYDTGNNYTGDASPLSDSMIAVNAQTGTLLWSKQILNNDIWVPAHPIGPDWDFSAGPQLFTGTVNGQTRQLVGAGAKSGIYWAFDRQTGQIAWATGISNGGTLGGMHAEASIANNMILAYGNDSFGVDQAAGTANPADHPMEIKALDPGTGKPLWVIHHAQPAALRAPGFLSNDVYLVPSLDGKFRAYRTADSQQLFTSMLHGSIGSGINVVGSSVFFGTGVVKLFGGNGGSTGVVAYVAAPGGTTTPAATTPATPTAPATGGTTPAPATGGTAPAPATGGGGTAPAAGGGGGGTGY